MEVVCLAVQMHRLFNVLAKYADSSLKHARTWQMGDFFLAFIRQDNPTAIQ